MNKTLLAVCFAFIATLSSVAHSAPLLNWSISGPGSTNVSSQLQPPFPGVLETTGNYAINPAGFSTRTWTMSAIAPEAGDYSLDWDYSGFHAFFAVTAFLNASDPTNGTTSLYSAGPQNCCTTPSAGFGVMGSHTFSGVSAGDLLTFTFGGRNGDSNNQLRGTLVLSQVVAPEPASMTLWAVLGLTAAGAGFRRRRMAKS